MTWTPVTPQSETWTEHAIAVRVFDPHVFDRNPIFDTGSNAGLWNEQAPQDEVWTPA